MLEISNVTFEMLTKMLDISIKMLEISPYMFGISNEVSDILADVFEISKKGGNYGVIGCNIPLS